jgi:predicted DNA-binding transcriptional regulator AlpA
MNKVTLRPRIVKLISRLLKPLTEEGVILVPEEKEIIRNLKHLAAKGSMAPAVAPKLIDQKEAAEMLGLSHSNFKKLEREEAFPFKRKMLGSAVRYRNLDIIRFIQSEE